MEQTNKQRQDRKRICKKLGITNKQFARMVRTLKKQGKVIQYNKELGRYERIEVE